jgi:hypothetical protein
MEKPFMHEKSTDTRDLLRHAVATLAYRGGKALRGAPGDFGQFCVKDGSRTPSEVLAHIGDLLDWALSLAKGAEAWRPVAPQAWDRDLARFYDGLERLDAELASERPLRCSYEKLLQGPLADALTHVGQIAMMRRLAGSPVRGENYFAADIAAGRVGAEQSQPRREFD